MSSGEDSGGDMDFNDDEIVVDLDDLQRSSAASDGDQQTLPPASLMEPLPSCSYLCRGQVFQGRQEVLFDDVSGEQQDWGMRVIIQECVMLTGYVCGLMQAAVNDPQDPVVTFWEGEVIDNTNHTFRTSNTCQGLSVEGVTDELFWKRFDAFKGVQLEEKVDGRGLQRCQHVFMRWKERKFVGERNDRGLTIDGFYYICLDRVNGNIVGYYYDPQPRSAPNQRLQLSAGGSSMGQAFSQYEFI